MPSGCPLTSYNQIARRQNPQVLTMRQSDNSELPSCTVSFTATYCMRWLGFISSELNIAGFEEDDRQARDRNSSHRLSR